MNILIDTLLHDFRDFCVFKTPSGDYFIEQSPDEDALILSPDGSDQHQHEIDWIESADRTQDDFIGAYGSCLAMAEGSTD